MRMVKPGDNITLEELQTILAQVPDPEIPVLSIVDLGILRDIRIDNGHIGIFITPTYSGCPAMDIIRMQIRMALIQSGIENFTIHTVLSPAWTTDWMTREAKEKLESYGIAPPPPVPQVCHLDLFQSQEAIRCPRCHSFHTTLISQFGSTPCKALYRCEDCHEPFDHFKCH